MFEQIEKALINRGHVHSTLSVHCFATILERLYRSKKSKKEQIDWMFDLFDHVYRSMSLRQWEIQHVKTLQSLEKLEDVDGTLTSQQQNLLELCRERIQALEIIWWHQNRNYYGHLFNKPKGAMPREIALISHEAARANTIHPKITEMVDRTARDACKAVGGCCTYGCGCCSKEREPGVLMHCTEVCGCCMARKGLELQDLCFNMMPEDNVARFQIAAVYFLRVGLEGVANKR